MSNKRSGRKAKRVAGVAKDQQTNSVFVGETSSNWLSSLSRNAKLLTLGIIIFLSVGALGAGLKYLEEDAQKQSSVAPKDQSMLSKVNPFISAPLPTPTPQLSKEYIYAGSRLLAVEDANANAAPPADLAVWRPSEGTWWVLGGPGSQQTVQQWGLTGDIAVPGDYDGDGKTDFSVFRPSSGEWYVINSSSGSSSIWQWGLAGDIPAPADFDGDGKTDRAVWRPSDGTWSIVRSSDQTVIYTQFGLSTDIPAPADYDGDGKADITVWRTSDTKFYSIRSSDITVQIIPLNQTGTPVPGDYDGDGKADYAVKNGSDWIIRNSATSVTSVTTWQLAADKPVQNDYDADGKVDIATWRDSNGNWYIRQSGSSNSLRQVQWGMSGDIPVPAFYRR